MQSTKPLASILICLDDVSMASLKYFRFCDEARDQIPGLFVIAFMIAKGIDKHTFGDWYLRHRQWVQIGVHGYDHENFREQKRDNVRELILKSLEILRPFLPEKYLYRPPGFQRTKSMEFMLKDLGFAGIAYRTRIKYFNGKYIEKFINMHCCNSCAGYENAISGWKYLLNGYDQRKNNTGNRATA